MNKYSLTTDELRELYHDIYLKADRIVAKVLILMFLFGIFIAFFYETWFVAVGVGGLCLLAYFLTKKLLPHHNVYQYVLSAISAIFAAQYIYQMHGLAEMHFWVFISSTILIIYQNWKLQLPLIVIVCIHHATFAYLQYSGFQEIYFTQLEYMDLTTFIFHAVLAACVTFVSALWSYNLRTRTVHDASNYKTLAGMQEELKKNARKMDELNQHLMAVNKEVHCKNDELQAYGEELLASEEELKLINENLNNIVENRNQALIKQNEKLIQHAFINAHKVRSPLARILGLVNLIKYELRLDEKEKDLVNRLHSSSQELDEVLKEVRLNLEDDIKSDPVRAMLNFELAKEVFKRELVNSQKPR
jgi:signal transduction histidine kinase